MFKYEEKYIDSLPLSYGHDIIIIVSLVKIFFDHSDTYNAPIDVFDFSVIKTSLLATHILPAILMYAALQDFKKIVTVQNKNKCRVKKKEWFS